MAVATTLDRANTNITNTNTGITTGVVAVAGINHKPDIR
eukprot:CAMPEP_0201611566 /NCGR_PEP_ID=MMETSP0492-20130828/20447_1 /ASSEMBLY_ACC=CAM_ASM_000837 /TAXON_ID=420259 /ORGANISM="Thalassiosira gravida, Strain GMp14c1" /LENGTH=38 /DNA_ID= /DNA_START= /DNA_END= /DNA_ORIENTATION=